MWEVGGKERKEEEERNMSCTQCSKTGEEAGGGKGPESFVDGKGPENSWLCRLGSERNDQEGRSRATWWN